MNGMSYGKTGQQKARHKKLVTTLMMEAASTSETSVNFYQTTPLKIPEDSYLHTRRRKNLKSRQDRALTNNHASRRI
jgi:hypothetical protein